MKSNRAREVSEQAFNELVEAVEAGKIAWSRYASYLAIYEDIPEYYTE